MYESHLRDWRTKKKVRETPQLSLGCSPIGWCRLRTGWKRALKLRQRSDVRGANLREAFRHL